MIRAIVAIDDRQGISAVEHPPYHIPWDIPADRAYYKQKTTGSTVVMGSATYRTLEAPMPERRNVVVSHQLESVDDGFELVQDLDKYLQQAEDDVWIIGGAAIYEAALEYCQELYITHVVGDYNCDRFFPDYVDQFSLQSESAQQNQNGYTYRFAVYTKNR